MPQKRSSEDGLGKTKQNKKPNLSCKLYFDGQALNTIKAVIFKLIPGTDVEHILCKNCRPQLTAKLTVS